ncbi:hypothetical protein [Actinoplanes philippinensis]|uniref:hypothetical protein n=1 Tax=Actinoplanes philippinensis TaxID=35752 RepID=UPI0033F84FA7
MSSLDLGPPTEPLVLTPPAAVVEVTQQQAAAAVPVPAPRLTELQQRAGTFADELAALDFRSPEFTQKVASITSMGEQDMRAAATAANRMLDRPAAVLDKRGDDAQARVAGTLAGLRVKITELDPKRADLTGKS